MKVLERKTQLCDYFPKIMKLPYEKTLPETFYE